MKTEINMPKWKIILNLASKFLTAIWILLIVYLIYLVYPFISVMISIGRIPTTYFEISLKGNQAVYHQTKLRPKNWVNLNDISKRLRGAIISSEDGKFYFHPGYDSEELQDAINDGLVKKKKKVRGASTITQQLIKNLYFQNDRSFTRKTKEMGMTLLIEDKVSKDKILETYLNVIEYGEKIFGIKEASQHYFKKLPRDLNARESAFLAMLLPSPKRYSQSFKRKELTAFAKKTVNSILFKMLQGRYIGIEEYQTNIAGRMAWEKFNEPEIFAEPLLFESETSSDDLGDF